MAISGYSIVPELMTNETEHRRQLARATKGIIAGRINVGLDATLNANSATTTLTDARISSNSSIIPAMAKTANAAAAIASGIWVSNQTTGSATLNHLNSSSTDKSIRFVIIG